MDVKEAVATAKAYARELFVDDIASVPVLEEVEFDDDRDVLGITVSFLRLPEFSRADGEIVGAGQPSRGGMMAGILAATPRRAVKVVNINDRIRNIISVKDRELDT